MMHTCRHQQRRSRSVSPTRQRFVNVRSGLDQRKTQYSLQPQGWRESGLSREQHFDDPEKTGTVLADPMYRSEESFGNIEKEEVKAYG
jgi:hypothetical protein